MTNTSLENTVGPAADPIINPLVELAAYDTREGVRSFLPALLSGHDFSAMEIKPREKLMGTWFREGDLGFIFGQRGQGKTWFTLALSLALASGSPFGPWPGHRACRILYVDGEMPLDELQKRARLLGGIPGNLYILSHEQCFNRLNAQINLADPEQQQRLIQTIKAAGIEVVVFDNLSCLFGGVRENDADDWEKVLPWLFALRRMRVSVIVMHHANRGGHEMRGTSRREDAAFWVIKLVKDEATVGERRTRFTTVFTKNRQGDREDVEDLLWTLDKPADADRLLLLHEFMGKVESLVRLIREGVNSNQEIAKEMGTSTSSVTRIAKAAMERGLIQKSGSKYVVVS